MSAQPRLSARALVVHERKLLLVNATPDKGDGKWCTPGGGIEKGDSLHDTLVREVHEETGLSIRPGEIAAVSEYLNEHDGFHQIDLFFQTTLTSNADIPQEWQDPSNVVALRGFFSLADMEDMNVLPPYLKEGFWLTDTGSPVIYRGRH